MYIMEFPFVLIQESSSSFVLFVQIDQFQSKFLCLLYEEPKVDDPRAMKDMSYHVLVKWYLDRIKSIVTSRQSERHSLQRISIDANKFGNDKMCFLISIQSKEIHRLSSSSPTMSLYSKELSILESVDLKIRLIRWADNWLSHLWKWRDTCMILLWRFDMHHTRTIIYPR